MKFLQFSIILFIFFQSICNIQSFSSLSIKSSSSFVQQSAPVNITWYNSDPTSTNDWIAFWEIGTALPPKGHNFVPFSWQFTYGGQTKLPLEADQHPNITGTIAIIAPPKTGVYRVYYCLNNNYNCPAFIEITVINAEIPKVKCSKNKKTLSNIEHIIFIVSENHSFDSIYGAYCKANTSSNPSCTNGPLCCEAAPQSLNGVSRVTLTDAQNVLYDPDHSQTGEVCKQNNRRMDSFIENCGDSSNSFTFAVADEKSAIAYYQLASQYAIADRFFQSAAGASSENDMYYITGQFLFIDNDYKPQNSSLNGARCFFLKSDRFVTYYNPTILDLLNECDISWANYAEGWDANATSTQCYPDFFDATDFAASYYPSLTKDENWKDYTKFFIDVEKGELPAYSYIKGLGVNSEHPGYTLSAGEMITDKVVSHIMKSEKYNKNTLIVIVPDESGGFYDHITPPEVSTIDGQPYGPRIPLLLVGDAVKKNYVSHVRMEPTSLIKFIEWNWFEGETGQLKTRDQVVANIGDMIDGSKAGIDVPAY